ncbi:MAG: hypothetical protein J6N21_09640 [Butyrivibrio sp.]|nr:hypothetical protein [Butyrivibrio sp.]
MSKRVKRKQTKYRKHAVQVHFMEPTKVTGVRIENNNIHLYSDGEEVIPKEASFIKFYERDSGKDKKTLELKLKSANFDVSHAVRNIDVVIVIDTNTDIKTCRAVSVAMFYLLIKDKNLIEYELHYMGTMIKMFINKTKVSSELWALEALLKEISEGKIGHIIEGDDLLVFIDHNLDKIEQFNSRELSLIPNDESSYLPEKVTLAYASSDAKHDSEFNEIMAECDRIATLELKNVL